ncbi:unnamed protein product, partial [Trichogramma brassicae]
KKKARSLKANFFLCATRARLVVSVAHVIVTTKKFMRPSWASSQGSKEKISTIEGIHVIESSKAWATQTKLFKAFRSPSTFLRGPEFFSRILSHNPYELSFQTGQCSIILSCRCCYYHAITARRAASDRSILLRTLIILHNFSRRSTSLYPWLRRSSSELLHAREPAHIIYSAFHQPHTHLHTHTPTSRRCSMSSYFGESVQQREKSRVLSLTQGGRLFALSRRAAGRTPTVVAEADEVCDGSDRPGVHGRTEMTRGMRRSSCSLLSMLSVIVMSGAETVTGIPVTRTSQESTLGVVGAEEGKRERERQDWQWEIIIFLARQKRGRRGGDLARRGTRVYIYSCAAAAAAAAASHDSTRCSLLVDSRHLRYDRRVSAENSQEVTGRKSVCLCCSSSSYIYIYIWRVFESLSRCGYVCVCCKLAVYKLIIRSSRHRCARKWNTCIERTHIHTYATISRQGVAILLACVLSYAPAAAPEAIYYMPHVCMRPIGLELLALAELRSTCFRGCLYSKLLIVPPVPRTLCAVAPTAVPCKLATRVPATAWAVVHTSFVLDITKTTTAARPYMRIYICTLKRCLPRYKVRRIKFLPDSRACMFHIFALNIYEYIFIRVIDLIFVFHLHNRVPAAPLVLIKSAILIRRAGGATAALAPASSLRESSTRNIQHREHGTRANNTITGFREICMPIATYSPPRCALLHGKSWAIAVFACLTEPYFARASSVAAAAALQGKTFDTKHTTSNKHTLRNELRCRKIIGLTLDLQPAVFRRFFGGEKKIYDFLYSSLVSTPYRAVASVSFDASRAHAEIYKAITRGRTIASRTPTKIELYIDSSAGNLLGAYLSCTNLHESRRSVIFAKRKKKKEKSRESPNTHTISFELAERVKISLQAVCIPSTHCLLYASYIYGSVIVGRGAAVVRPSCNSASGL